MSVPVRYRIRRNTTSGWSTANPVLSQGEVGLELTSTSVLKAKIGDGVTAWNNLAYFGSGTASTLVDDLDAAGILNNEYGSAVALAVSAMGESSDDYVFRLGQSGDSSISGAYSTDAFHFPSGFWWDAPVFPISRGANPDHETFWELLTQPMDDGLGSIDAFEGALLYKPDVEYPIPYFEATRIGGLGESIQFLADPAYYDLLGWDDDGWRMPTGQWTHLAISFEYNINGTWRGRFLRLVDEDESDLTTDDGRTWKIIFEIKPGDGVFPDQGPGSIILTIDEPIWMGRDIGYGLLGDVTVRDGVDGELVAYMRPESAAGRTVFEDDTGRLWTAESDAYAAHLSDVAVDFASRAYNLALSNQTRITVLEEA